MNFRYRKFPVDLKNCPFPNTCEVGFSYEMEKLAYGLLGQDGFFNKWTVKFEYQKENIDLKEIVSR